MLCDTVIKPRINSLYNQQGNSIAMCLSWEASGSPDSQEIEAFYGTRGSLPCSQGPTTDPRLDPVNLVHPTSYFSKSNFDIIVPLSDYAFSY
jgi:hypothetical protein